jgi:integrase
MVLYLVLDCLDVDLNVRLREFRLLELGELDELVSRCQWQIDHIIPNAAFDEKTTSVRAEGKSARTKLQDQRFVEPETAAIRLRYILAYLRWMTADRLLKMGVRHHLYKEFSSLVQLCLGALAARVPRTSQRNTLTQREGLTEDSIALLEGSILPNSEKNPWTGVHPRLRNQLLVRWLKDLGIRRGELLGVRIRDINFQRNEVRITRHADDPDDPRKYQPNTKTKDRLLYLGEELAQLTRTYVSGARRQIKGARRHDYLFVTNGSGQPLSLSAVNKIFKALRAGVRGLPGDLSPHVLRHTWNDDFSAMVDNAKVKVSDADEQKMRSRLQGWSETSGTAMVYTRRHSRRKAREISLSMQRRLVERDTDDK